MLLDKLEIGADVEQNEDFLPGNNFILDTGLYPMNVDMAFMGESARGAVFITLHLKENGGNRTHRETFYVTSNKENGRRNTYVDKRSGKARLLPGMESANQLSIITTGKKLSALETTEKIIKMWNFDSRSEENTPVPCLTEMLNKPVLVAITKRRENKNTKVGNDWIPTNDERLFNEAGKFLYPNGLSVAEKIAGQTETTYRDNWADKFSTDYVNDRYKALTTDSAVETASTEAAEETAGEIDSMFDD